MEAHFEKVFEGIENDPSKRRERPVAVERPAKKVAKTEVTTPIELPDMDDNPEFMLNPRIVKQMVQSLEKKLQKNEMMRAKHTEDPTKFMESELALHEDISRMKNIATDPELFEVLIENEAIPMFIQLLTHENLDIRMDIIALLADMTDVERVGEMAFAEAVVKAIMGYKGLELLVENLRTLLSEASFKTDEVKRVAVYNLLQIIENLSELLPESCSLLCSSTPLLNLLVAECYEKESAMSENKLYCSEILSILVQASDEAATSLGNFTVDDEPLDILLQCLAAYRKKDPSGDEEEEFVHNLFNALCSALRIPKVQDRFRSLQGFELMLRCIKENKFCKAPALRVLDHAIMSHARNCERIVELGGLKQLFPLFMGKLRSKKDKQKTNDEHLMSLFASLSLWLPLESKYDVRDRFQAKFLENSYEKTDRVIDLLLQYHTAMNREVQEPQPPADMNSEEAVEAYEALLEAYRLHQLDNGLFTLQQVCFVLAHMCQVFAKTLLPYVIKKLHVHAMTLSTVAQVLTAQADMMDDEHEVQQDRLRALVQFLDDNSNPNEEETKDN
ncbi:beta-catenin [Thraustotheca clavata]|uniref:Beta-catenin n=1 Tax=Thraustotheca clavata TaxID=74557 RepID=A0A1V9ZFA0_9STRA|nr:beta-catenin [Thraustotheca clavata]